MDHAAELVSFCKQHGGPAFGLWDAETLRNHLVAHVAYGTLIWVRSPSGRIAGVGTVWPCSADWLRYLEEDPCDGKPPDWRNTDAIYLADWVATEPGAMRSMILAFLKRIDVAGKRFFAHRKGRLVEVSRKEVARLVTSKTRRSG